MLRPVHFALVFAVASLLAGCGGNGAAQLGGEQPKENPAQDAADTETGPQRSPESVFQAFQKATAEENWPEAFGYLTPVSQDVFILDAIVHTYVLSLDEDFLPDEKKTAELKAAVKPFGLDLADLEGVPPEEGTPHSALANVKDKPGLMRALVAWIEKYQHADTEGNFFTNRIARIRLKDLQIDGDRAVGRRIEYIGKGGEQVIAFKRLDGKWYVDLAEAERIQAGERRRVSSNSKILTKDKASKGKSSARHKSAAKDVTSKNGRSAVDLAPVTGRITLDGEPLAGATVMFTPLGGTPGEDFKPKPGSKGSGPAEQPPEFGGGPPSVGITDNEGRYTLKHTLNLDGAIVGKHTVSISTFGEFEEGGKVEVAPERVPDVYNVRSELTAAVKRGDNRLDFDLESSAGKAVQPFDR